MNETRIFLGGRLEHIVSQGYAGTLQIESTMRRALRLERLLEPETTSYRKPRTTSAAKGNGLAKNDCAADATILAHEFDAERSLRDPLNHVEKSSP